MLSPAPPLLQLFTSAVALSSVYIQVQRRACVVGVPVYPILPLLTLSPGNISTFKGKPLKIISSTKSPVNKRGIVAVESGFLDDFVPWGLCGTECRNTCRC